MCIQYKRKYIIKNRLKFKMQNSDNRLEIPFELFRPIQPPKDAIKIKGENSTTSDIFGFRILVDKSNNCEMPLNTEYNYLKLWYLKYALCDKSKQIHIKGTLINYKNNNIVEDHNAGILQSLVKNDLIVTSIGTYKLIGPPSPKSKHRKYWDFYNAYDIIGGFPINYKQLTFK